MLHATPPPPLYVGSLARWFLGWFIFICFRLPKVCLFVSLRVSFFISKTREVREDFERQQREMTDVLSRQEQRMHAATQKLAKVRVVACVGLCVRARVRACVAFLAVSILHPAQLPFHRVAFVSPAPPLLLRPTDVRATYKPRVMNVVVVDVVVQVQAALARAERSQVTERGAAQQDSARMQIRIQNVEQRLQAKSDRVTRLEKNNHVCARTPARVRACVCARAHAKRAGVLFAETLPLLVRLFVCPLGPSFTHGVRDPCVPRTAVAEMEFLRALARRQAGRQAGGLAGWLAGWLD